MNTKRLFLTTLIVSTLTMGAMGTTAQASPAEGKHSAEKRAQFMQKRMNRIANKLGLSDEQKAQWSALRKNKRNTLKPLREERKSLRKQINQLDPKASNYDSQLAELANTQSELTRQVIMIKGDSRKQMAQFLSPDQIEKMKSMRKHRRGGFHRGHGKRGAGKKHGAS